MTATSAELIRMARRALTVGEIAAAAHMRAATVRRRLRILGVRPVDGRALRRPAAGTLPRPAGDLPPAVRALREASYWPDVVRDYAAGDSMRVLARRYGCNHMTMKHALHDDEDATVRKATEGIAVHDDRSDQASAILYRLREGALEEAAAKLGVSSALLQEVLDGQGLLPHDLDADEEFGFPEDSGV
ncbi:hypothetical protein QFZ75_008035 [Streptomyces sp. V3I8]|uniref:hypothetical protein n=1 Tax=Streptomyces sp. V3I8 TaxID=3042279 RepID=UPI002788C1D4|nr:hypothetical protein [Streptomyces sp. V3I8]MDQ1041533.1 hypothetical protein [Streptomyces sp. V3I8]